MARPHRIVGDAADGLANGASRVGNSLVGTAKGLGSQVMGILDKPFSMVTDKQGPHHIIDRLVNGGVDAGNHAVDSGILGSLKTAGNGFMRALDQPVEATGLPPDLGSIRLPSLKRK